MKVWLLLFVCLLGAALTAADAEKTPPKEKKSLEQLAQEALAQREPTEEEKKLNLLLNQPSRDTVLGFASGTVEQLEKNDLTAMSYSYYLVRIAGFEKDQYFEGDTELDRAWLKKLSQIYTYLQQNRERRDFLKAGAKAQSPEIASLNADRQKALKILKKLVEHPEDASGTIVKKQQKEKEALIKDLNKIIKEQQKEALKAEKERLRKEKHGKQK